MSGQRRNLAPFGGVHGLSRADWPNEHRRFDSVNFTIADKTEEIALG